MRPRTARAGASRGRARRRMAMQGMARMRRSASSIVHAATTWARNDFRTAVRGSGVRVVFDDENRSAVERRVTRRRRTSGERRHAPILASTLRDVSDTVLQLRKLLSTVLVGYPGWAAPLCFRSESASEYPR